LPVPERNPTQINLKEFTETDAMRIQFPQDLISAENNNFVLYVDGKEKNMNLLHRIILLWIHGFHKCYTC